MQTGTIEEAAWLILRYRRALFSYLLAVVRDYALAEDLFQEVSMVLLGRWESFGEVRDFWGLARETARRQALSALRKRHRDRQLLTEHALDAVDRGFDTISSELETRTDALRRCMGALPSAWKEIVELRYWVNAPVSEIARKTSKTESVIFVTLNRIRMRLASCVQLRLRSAGMS